MARAIMLSALRNKKATMQETVQIFSMLLSYPAVRELGLSTVAGSAEPTLSEVHTEFTVGRDGDIRIPNHLVSRIHCRLAILDTGEVRVEDLSRHGTAYLDANGEAHLLSQHVPVSLRLPVNLVLANSVVFRWEDFRPVSHRPGAITQEVPQIESSDSDLHVHPLLREAMLTFNQNLPDMLREHLGQYVAIHRDKILGYAPTFHEADALARHVQSPLPIFIGYVSSETRGEECMITPQID